MNARTFIAQQTVADSKYQYIATVGHGIEHG
jgi:hypothetical protein